MVNVKIEIHNRGKDLRKEVIKDWNSPDSVKKNIIIFLEELELGKVNKGFKVSESRQSKYLDLLKLPLEYWNKTEDKIAPPAIKCHFL